MYRELEDKTTQLEIDKYEIFIEIDNIIFLKRRTTVA